MGRSGGTSLDLYCGLNQLRVGMMGVWFVGVVWLGMVEIVEWSNSYVHSMYIKINIIVLSQSAFVHYADNSTLLHHVPLSAFVSKHCGTNGLPRSRRSR